MTTWKNNIDQAQSLLVEISEGLNKLGSAFDTLGMITARGKVQGLSDRVKWANNLIDYAVDKIPKETQCVECKGSGKGIFAGINNKFNCVACNGKGSLII